MRSSTQCLSDFLETSVSFSKDSTRFLSPPMFEHQSYNWMAESLQRSIQAFQRRCEAGRLARREDCFEPGPEQLKGARTGLKKENNDCTGKYSYKMPRTTLKGLIRKVHDPGIYRGSYLIRSVSGFSLCRQHDSVCTMDGPQNQNSEENIEERD